MTLPKPYYEHQGMTIYNGDAREILPLLEPGSVDLIVTDPPYGQDYNAGNRRQQRFESIIGDATLEEAQSVTLEVMGLVLKVLEHNRHLYWFGRADLTSLNIGPVAELIWDKGQMNLGNLEIVWGKAHEYIQFAVGKRWKMERTEGGLTARLRRGSVLRYPRLNSVQVINHPSEKPVMLLRELIEASSRIGDTVLDPFMGSGSTLVAAQVEGRKAIGIEIELKYCQIAVQRMSQEVMPL